jgi:KUP system potassium uptake protein
MPHPPASKPGLPTQTLAALGVVFGDIGTNPLFAIRQCFQDTPSLAGDPGAITGILSLILWSLVLVVCVKYLGFVLRADHEGEGGTLAMLGLLHDKDQARRRSFPRPDAVTLLVLFGSAMLYGDGVVTPAISVLSAVEGLDVATDAFKPFILPIAIGILVALFLLQQRGTEKVGRLFGPVMALWFLTIAALGVVSILRHPAILAAFDPRAGLAFLLDHGWSGYAVLGAVVLCFAGAEALFADLGHFGRRPIVLGWYCLVLPALALNYLGQGALIQSDPKAASGPFFALVPHWGLYPMVLLSTVATVIASQALISGAFSLTQQAVHMGYCPRLAIRHTSRAARGQIYMPSVNALLMIACIAVVLGFRSSEALGNAYGLAVIGTMTITSVVYFLVIRRVWHWSFALAAPILVGFLVIDLAFLGANVAKLFSGAWVPLVIGGVVFAIMAIWTDGRACYAAALSSWALPVQRFQAMMQGWKRRSESTVVMLTADPDFVPLIRRHGWLRANLRSQDVILVTILTSRSPFVDPARAMTVETLEYGLHRIIVTFGFMQEPDVAATLEAAREGGLRLDWEHLAFYLPQPERPPGGGVWAKWRDRIFVFLWRTGLSTMEYYRIPANKTISIGLELADEAAQTQSAQPEEREDSDNHNHQSDDVNDAVHVG